MLDIPLKISSAAIFLTSIMIFASLAQYMFVDLQTLQIREIRFQSLMLGEDEATVTVAVNISYGGGEPLRNFAFQLLTDGSEFSSKPIDVSRGLNLAVLKLNLKYGELEELKVKTKVSFSYMGIFKLSIENQSKQPLHIPPPIELKRYRISELNSTHLAVDVSFKEVLPITLKTRAKITLEGGKGTIFTQKLAEDLSAIQLIISKESYSQLKYLRVYVGSLKLYELPLGVLHD